MTNLLYKNHNPIVSANKATTTPNNRCTVNKEEKVSLNFPLSLLPISNVINRDEPDANEPLII